jgi:CMP-N-acetylneuraminic acid synthetase
VKFVGVVPARAGSKRLLGKNMRLLQNRPLVQWVIETAKESSLDHVLVTSDDEGVLALADRFGVMTVRRPAHLAQDDSDIIDGVLHAIKELTIPLKDSDAIVLLQPTSPFTRAEDINNACNLLQTSESDSVVSVMEVEHHLHPTKFKTIIDGRLYPYFVPEQGSSFQQLEKVYVRNGSIYAARLRLLQTGKFFDDESVPLVMPRSVSVDINDEVDFALAELVAESLVT